MYQYEKAGKETRGRERVKRNDTEIPPQLKRRVEESSGLSLDDVRVSYHSDRPARLDAYAYTQGNRVYIGPGQERHLPHELGHVVQQKRGIVRADTRHASGVKMNTDPVLERQADEIGRAVGGNGMVQGMAVSDGPVQRNPFDKSAERECVGGLPQTAHHIIPQNLLKAALKLLNREQKQELYWRAGVPWVRKDQTGNFTESDHVSYVNQYNETEEDYLIWPQGNLFYGPNTMIRAETGEKEGFDYDARYMGVMDQKRFDRMKEIYDGLQRALNERDAGQLFDILKEFYGLTALEGFEPRMEPPLLSAADMGQTDEGEGHAEPGEAEEQADLSELERLMAESRVPVLQAPAAYSQDDWVEITEQKELEKIKKYRNNIGRYTYFKVPVDQTAGGEIPPGCARGSGNMWQYQYRDNSKTAIIKNIAGIISLGANGSFLLATFSKNPVLRQDNASITVYLPARLVDYINSLENMRELRNRIAELEKNQSEIVTGLLQQFGQVASQVMGSAGYEEMTEHCPLIAFCNKTVKRYKGKPIPLDNIDQERQSAELQDEYSMLLSAYVEIDIYFTELERWFGIVGAKIMELKSSGKSGKEGQGREAAEELFRIESSFAVLRERLSEILMTRRVIYESVFSDTEALDKIFRGYST